jgi:RNA polymerase sigma-70 factor (ECF subfamily)
MPPIQTAQVPTDIVLRAQRGDRDAHECIYRQLSQPVYTLIRRLVVRPAVAQDLLQDVFVEVLRNLSDYRAIGSFEGWVKSIAINKALMYLRSPWHRSLRWLDADVISGLHAEACEQLAEPMDADLARALEQLPPLSRAVVWLHDVEDFTHAEIARMFGRTTSFSKSQLARAHEQLRERLKPDTGGLSCMPISKNC